MNSYIILGKLGPIFDIRTNFPNSIIIEFNTREEAEAYANTLNEKYPYNYKVMTFAQYMKNNTPSQIQDYFNR